MLAVRCSFKPEMHQFHSFHKFLYTLPHLKNLRASYPGAVSCLNQKGLGIGKTKNNYLENIYIYSSISGIQDQVSILLGWLYFKDSSFFHFTKMCRGYLYIIYIYVNVLSTMTVTSGGTCTTSTDSVGLYNISSLILDFFHLDVVLLLCRGIETMIPPYVFKGFFRSNAFRCMFFQKAAFLQSF